MVGKVAIIVLAILVDSAWLRVVQNESGPGAEMAQTEQSETTLQNEVAQPVAQPAQDVSTPSDEVAQSAQDESTSSNIKKPEFGSIELHQIGALMNSEIEYLNCSALRHDVIRMYNVKVLTMENPCSINASLVIMVNSQFPSSQQAFNINGKVIKLINNVFTGTEQDHYIVGDHVLLANNKYEGQIQIHEVAGSEIFVISNRFDGNWRVHQYAARRVVLYSNEYYGVHYDFSFPTYYRNTMHNMYSYERLNPTDEYVNLLESLGHINTGFYGPAKNQLPSGSVLEFLEDMISGTKIKRPEESYVIATLRKLTQHL